VLTPVSPKSLLANLVAKVRKEWLPTSEATLFWLSLDSMFLPIVFGLAGLQGAGPTLPNGAFLRLPYLQIGNQTTVKDELTLVWHVPGDDQGKWTVRYRTIKDMLSVDADEQIISTTTPAFKSFTADLSELQPGVPFGYEVLRDNKVVFSSTAKAPKYAAKKWRLVSFGDCGAGTKDQAAVAFQVSRSSPDLILSTGDTVYTSSTVAEYETKFWSYYNGPDAGIDKGAPLMRRIPWVAVPGNHDFYSNDLTKTPDGLAYFYFWKQPLNGPELPPNSPMTPMAKGKGLDAFLRAAGPTYPRMANFSFEYGNVHFVVLNSNPNVNWTDRELRAWLENDLQNARPDFWRIIAYHHPEFQSSKAHADNKWMRVLSDLYAKHKVDMVLNGHVHNYQRSYPIQTSFKPLISSALNKNDWPIDTRFDGASILKTDGVIRIVTGAGGAPLYNPEIEAKRDEWLPFTNKYIVKHSFSQLDFDGDMLFFRQIDRDGNLLDQFKLSRKSKTD
jgi:acid phosphatase type 7